MSDSFRAVNGDGALIVTLVGAALEDPERVDEMGEALDRLVTDSRDVHVIIDMADVRCLSSQALGIIVNLRRKVAQHGRHVVLSRTREELVRLFRLTNLDRLFKFFDSNDDALAQLPPLE